jgi:hypothetical protein
VLEAEAVHDELRAGHPLDLLHLAGHGGRWVWAAARRLLTSGCCCAVA